MLARLLEDLREMGTKRVELAGRGEPTLHPQFEKIIEMLKDCCFNVGVVTNGSLLNHESYDHLVRCGLDRIVVSLNAATRETYPIIHTTAKPETYDNVVRNLKGLNEIKRSRKRKNPRVMLSFVIMRANWNQGLKMIDLASDIGADEVVFKYAVAYPSIKHIELTDEEKLNFSRQVPLFMKRAESEKVDLKIEPPIGDMNANPDLYHRKTKTIYSKIPCYIGWCFALVTAEGSVSPCCQCMEQMGNLTDQRFRDIWFSERYSDFREKMKRFPERYGDYSSCACDECAFEKINMTIYNKLHFYNPVHLYDVQREFSLIQLLPAILRGNRVKGAKTVKRSR